MTDSGQLHPSPLLRQIEPNAFVVTSPLVLLSYDYNPDVYDRSHNYTVALHEYMHFEQATTWAPLGLLRSCQIILVHQKLAEVPRTEFLSRIERLCASVYKRLQPSE